MSLPGYDLTGYAPAQLLNGSFSAQSGGISSEILQQLEQENYARLTTGQSPIDIPQTSDPMEFATQLYFNGGADVALPIANALGIPQETLNQNLATVNAQNQADRKAGWNPVLRGINSTTQDFADNPLAFTAKLGALGTGLSFLGGGAAAAGSGSATVTGAPIVSGGVAAPAAGAATTFPLPAAGGAITGSAIPGLTSATTAAGAAAAGIGPAAAAGAASGLGGLGLGGWLAVGGLAGQALQGNQDITTSSSNEPPAYIAPYLSGAAEQASNLYGQGNYVAPVTQSAIDYGTNVLNGNYLNSNPYLDETFKHAAGAVTNQVQSNFGISGRNARGIDAAGFAQEGYNDLANQIYGGNYQAERQRQQQILPYAGQLGSYTNPGTGLDDYIARLRNLSGGYGSSTSSTPTQQNWLSGLAGLGLALMN